MDEFAAFLRTQTLPVYVRLRITPGAQATQIMQLMDDDKTWKVRVAAPPEKGKANAELMRYLQKRFGVTAAIISGATDRTKLVKLDTSAPLG